MKYRSRSEIASTILQTTANGGATKTRIMYGAYLSYAQVKEYLKFLQGKQMLRLNEIEQTYHITEKGMQFLRVYDQIGEMISATSDRSAVPSSVSQQLF